MVDYYTFLLDALLCPVFSVPRPLCQALVIRAAHPLESILCDGASFTLRYHHLESVSVKGCTDGILWAHTCINIPRRKYWNTRNSFSMDIRLTGSILIYSTYNSYLILFRQYCHHGATKGHPCHFLQSHRSANGSHNWMSENRIYFWSM